MIKQSSIQSKISEKIRSSPTKTMSVPGQHKNIILEDGEDMIHPGMVKVTLSDNSII